MIAVLLFTMVTATRAFAIGAPQQTALFKTSSLLELRSSAAAVEGNTVASTKEANLPSWEDLQASLDHQAQEEGEASNDNRKNKAALVTLYRDTNGWCPFCERVWLALEIKQIPYEEQLINLQDKPSWFKQMVPTGLVPAVLFHSDAMASKEEEEEESSDNDEQEKPTPERTLVWESLNILKALDEQFPNTPRLILDDQEDYQRAREIVSNATTAGGQFVYSGRNQTMSDEEKQQKRTAFENALKSLDDFLQSQQSPKGGFCLGESISGVDIEMVPIMERWRYQLPLTINMTIYDTQKYPNLCKWYNAMDRYAPYTNRVAGDAYSWTAVASTFLRFFATGPNGTMSQETRATIDRADAVANDLTKTFASSNKYDETTQARIQAAAKLIGNHKAVVKDCINPDPKSQKELPRAQKEEIADLALRAVAQSLLTEKPPSLFLDDKDVAAEAASALRTVAARLSAPRDMGAPAAQMLRKTLIALETELAQ